jgi:hypothetical protein
MRPLALAALALACIGCTRIWPFNRMGAAATASTAAAPPAVLVSGANDAGLKATVNATKESRRALAVTLTLANSGTQAIEFRNPVSLRVAGFKVAADGREGIGADGGKLESKRTAAAQLKRLAAGGSLAFELKYTFDPALTHESYPWTLVISNAWIGEQKLADITLTYTPPRDAQ